MNNTAEAIASAAETSGLVGYSGEYEHLGGGELNNTYVLAAGGGKVILRIARYADHRSLVKEAAALRLLDLPGVPKLLYFDEQNKLDGRLWIMESYIAGRPVDRLSVGQFESLGALLARVHAVPGAAKGVDAWQDFLIGSRKFGDEATLLQHPDPVLRRLIQKGKTFFDNQKAILRMVVPVLVHGDATAGNILAVGDRVALIDWEFARFKDPMSEFPTIYYEDMEYNRGKWRVHITAAERQALFDGYTQADGTLDMDRITLWMVHDKLGAAVYLYWRLHESDWPTGAEQAAQYAFDLAALTHSLRAVLD